MGRIVMGYWDCQHCNTKKNPGTLRDCPNCGHPRSFSTKFYMDRESMPHYVDIATEKEVRARGKDWVCIYCGSLNNGLSQNCPSCGAPRTQQVIEESTSKPISVNSHGKQDIEQHLAESQDLKQPCGTTRKPLLRDVISQAFNTNRLKLFAKIGIPLLAVAAVVFLCIFLFTPKPIEFAISDISWEYNISIEKLTPVDESGWTLPSDARLRYTQMEVHHYDRVPDGYDTVTHQEVDYYEDKVIGYRDMGNGYFEEITTKEPHYTTVTEQVPRYKKVPVEQTKYYYTVDEWLHYRDVTTNGNNKSPYWGKVTLNSLEREGHRSQTYYISGFDKDDKLHTCSVDYSFWTNCCIGDYVKGTIDITNHFKPDETKGKENT